MTKDLEEIGEVAHHGPEDLFVAVMTFVGAFVLMFVGQPASWRCITALIVPVTGWITGRYGGRMTRTWRALFGRVGEFNARIEENVGGMRVVQAFANEDHERQLFAGDNARYRATKLEAYRIMAASMSLSYLSMRFTQLVVMIAGTYFVLHGELTEGGFVSFLLLVGVFFRPVEKINAVLETYPKGIAGFRRYTELLDTEPDIVDAPDAIAVSGSARRHPLRERDLRLRPGADGAARHRPRHPRRGDGRLRRALGRRARRRSARCCRASTRSTPGGSPSTASISATMTLASLRREIGIVQQDVFLFAGTIRENIAYGRLDATEDGDRGGGAAGQAGRR